ncbi:MAG TPA: branched-chain amino acid ABC transporter permease [Syntrophorhabdaceae bacterium]|nr:branched-chain amino acid ABC transporter permease [Syntrophorhabdaceae bacterium]
MKRLSRLWWILVVGFIALYPPTLGGMSSYKCGILIFIGIYIILAVSLDLLMGYAGQISVGHAAFFAIGAYVSGIMTARYSIAPVTAMVSGMALSAGVAWGMGRPVLALKEYYLAMATLALNEIVVTLIVGLHGLTGGASGLRDVPSFSIAGFTFASHVSYYYFVWALVILVVICSLAVVKSSFGRTLLAIHSDETAAKTFGIDCARYKVRIYVLSAVFASLAGSLFAHYMGFLAPEDFGVNTSINLLVMLFLGGTGTIFGPALGAIFLKYLPELTYKFQDYEMLINGVILIAVLVFMPRGIYGFFTSLKKRLFSREPGSHQEMNGTSGQ